MHPASRPLQGPSVCRWFAPTACTEAVLLSLCITAGAVLVSLSILMSYSSEDTIGGLWHAVEDAIGGLWHAVVSVWAIASSRCNLAVENIGGSDTTRQEFVSSRKLSKAISTRLISFNFGMVQSMLAPGPWTKKHRMTFLELMKTFTDNYEADLIFGCEAGGARKGLADLTLVDPSWLNLALACVQNYITVMKANGVASELLRQLEMPTQVDSALPAQPVLSKAVEVMLNHFRRPQHVSLPNLKMIWVQNYIAALNVKRRETSSRILELRVVQLASRRALEPQLVLTAVQVQQEGLKADRLVVGNLHIRKLGTSQGPSRLAARLDIVRAAMRELQAYGIQMTEKMPESEKHDPALVLLGDCGLEKLRAQEAAIMFDEARGEKTAHASWQVHATNAGLTGDVCFVKGCLVKTFEVAVGHSYPYPSRKDLHDALGLVLELSSSAQNE